MTAEQIAASRGYHHIVLILQQFSDKLKSLDHPAIMPDETHSLNTTTIYLHQYSHGDDEDCNQVDVNASNESTSEEPSPMYDSCTPRQHRADTGHSTVSSTSTTTTLSSDTSLSALVDGKNESIEKSYLGFLATNHELDVTTSTFSDRASKFE